MCLLRYLRARDWKVEKAEKMLKATIDWRREWHVEDIRREDVILTLVRVLSALLTTDERIWAQNGLQKFDVRLGNSRWPIAISPFVDPF